MKAYKRAVAVSCLIGLAVGLWFAGLAVWAAWDLNPQGSIHGDQGIDVLYLAMIAGSWIVVRGGPVALLLSALSCGGVALFRKARPV